MKPIGREELEEFIKRMEEKSEEETDPLELSNMVFKALIVQHEKKVSWKEAWEEAVEENTKGKGKEKECEN